MVELDGMLTGPKVILDCDGVVADFSNHLLRSVGSDKTLADVHQWEILSILTPEQKERARVILDGEEFWATLPLMPGAAEGVSQLRDAGWQIVWATSPWPSCRTWAAARSDWIRRNFLVARPQADPILIGRDKYLIDGNAFIDDKPEAVADWQRSHPNGRAWLFDAPYNRNERWPRRWSWNLGLAP